MTGENKKAMAIVRVSSARQKDNISHDTQESEIRRYCEENRLEVVAVERLVESAKNFEKRRDFSRAIETSLSQKIRHVVFYMFDRETRNLTDNESNEKLVREGKIVLHYVRDRKSLSHDSPDTDFFMRDIQAVTNKQYSRSLSTKVRDALEKKAQNGWYPANHLPMGYIHERQPQGTVVVAETNPRKIAQVTREFELRASGVSYREIRRRIVSEGFIPPEKIASYSVSTIEKRLKSPFYRGSFEWRGRIYPGKHPRIVPESLTNAVDENHGKRRARRLSVELHGIFSGGWLKCGDPECGCLVVYDPKRKTAKRSGVTTLYHYYHCTNGKRVHTTLAGANVREEKIWDALGVAVESIAITESMADQIATALNQLEVKAKGRTRDEIARYQEALKQLEGREDRFYDDYVAGILDETGYRRNVQRVRDERQRFTTLLERSQLQLQTATLETAKSILELATTAKTLWSRRSPWERRDFLDQILSNPVLDGANVRYELRKPFRVLAEMSEKGEWYPQPDSNRCLRRERATS